MMLRSPLEPCLLQGQLCLYSPCWYLCLRPSPQGFLLPLTTIGLLCQCTLLDTCINDFLDD